MAIEIRPVTNDTEHAAALKTIEALWNAEDAVSKTELDALVTLVDAYEQKIWPAEDALDPVHLLRHAMSEDVGHTRAELVELLGSASRVSEILGRKRALTLDMIRTISAAWGIPVALLSTPYELAKEVSAVAIRPSREHTSAHPSSMTIKGVGRADASVEQSPKSGKRVVFEHYPEAEPRVAVKKAVLLEKRRRKLPVDPASKKRSPASASKKA